MGPEFAQVGPLYNILDELMKLQALAEEPDLADEERAAISEQIAKYMSAQIVGRKIDGIAATLRECEARAAIAAEESKREAKRAESWLARFQRIKDATLRAMQAHGIKKLETPSNVLRIQGNGGHAPLEVYAAGQLPGDLRRYQVQLSGSDYVVLFGLVAISEVSKDERTRLLKVLEAARWEPDGERIREAMRGPRVECPECKGVLDVTKGCERCGAVGTVAPEVPGARLLERGVHLRVE